MKVFCMDEKPNPIVSIITSCYKGSKYLKTFLEELPLQTFFPYLEVVLAHNEPDKKEIKLINEFKNKYPGKINHIIFEKVTPLAVSWNSCIKNAKGQFLTIWNVDDLRTVNSIELQTTTLLNNKDIDVVYGDYKVVANFGKKEGKLILHEHIPESEFSRSMIWGPFFMFRKTLLSKTGLFDEQFRSALDLDFSIRASFHAKAKHVKENLGCFLSAGQGLSTKPDSSNDYERTAIELRYGIYDKIDFTKISSTTKYTIPFLFIENNWIPIERFIPSYNKILKSQEDSLLHLGLRNFYKSYKKQYGIIAILKKHLKMFLGR
jgi:glycosyltransferase involved in cell wall biosynthesis